MASPEFSPTLNEDLHFQLESPSGQKIDLDLRCGSDTYEIESSDVFAHGHLRDLQFYRESSKTTDGRCFIVGIDTATIFITKDSFELLLRNDVAKEYAEDASR